MIAGAVLLGVFAPRGDGSSTGMGEISRMLESLGKAVPEGAVESASADSMPAPADVIRIFEAAGVAAELDIPTLDELANIDTPYMIRTNRGDWYAFSPSVDGKLVPLGSGQQVPPEMFARTWSGWTVVIHPGLDPADVPEPPRAVLEPATISLGSRFAGEIPCATVAVRNAGGSPLRVRLAPDLADSAPPIETRGLPDGPVPAGATVEFAACARLSRFFRERNCTFLTNDPDRPVLVLRLTAVVLPSVRLDRDSVSLAEAAPGEIASATVRVSAFYPPEFAIESVGTSADALSASVREVAPGPPRLLDVEISLDTRKAPGGDFSGDVSLWTNNPADPRIVIPVRAAISGPAPGH